MKAIRIYALLVLLLLMAGGTMKAQQWEFDYANGDSLVQFSHGILDSEGNGILVGGCGPAYPDYHPIVMRVESDGAHSERQYEGLDGLMLTHVVQLPNGNYFVAGLISEEAVEVLVLDSNLEIMEDKRYEKPANALLLSGGRLLLEEDGTVVMCGSARYTSTYGGYRTHPFLYRFDENADTLHCRYVMPERPEPEYYIDQFECHQILKNPRDSGLILIGDGLHGNPSLICYDYDFNYISNIWMHNDQKLLFTQYSSCCWLSDDDLLVFGTLNAKNDQSRNIGLLDVKLSGGVRWTDTIRAEPQLPFRVASGKCNCATFVNDSTIYCSYQSSENLFGPYFPSVCLLNKDMEVLGNKVFLDEEYTNHPTHFTLPQNDRGCIIVTSFALVANNTSQGKLIKMSREDFNPVPAEVKEVPQEAIKALAYPNPAKDELNIDISGLPEHNEHRIQIADAWGHICMDCMIRGEGNVLTLGVSGLKAGVYAYRVYNPEKEVIVGKFVKE